MSAAPHSKVPHFLTRSEHILAIVFKRIVAPKARAFFLGRFVNEIDERQASGGLARFFAFRFGWDIILCGGNLKGLVALYAEYLRVTVFFQEDDHKQMEKLVIHRILLLACQF